MSEIYHLALALDVIMMLNTNIYDENYPENDST